MFLSWTENGTPLVCIWPTNGQCLYQCRMQRKSELYLYMFRVCVFECIHRDKRSVPQHVNLAAAYLLMLSVRRNLSKHEGLITWRSSFPSRLLPRKLLMTAKPTSLKRTNPHHDSLFNACKMIFFACKMIFFCFLSFIPLCKRM